MRNLVLAISCALILHALLKLACERAGLGDVDASNVVMPCLLFGIIAIACSRPTSSH